MSKMINIGGRIHSTEVGNVAVGANEVLDDTKGKKQNVINSETDAELLRLDQSKQNNLTFDNTPTENSTNPVTSGGVYAANITLHELIEAILALIPSAASALNQLADKAFVNSSVSTATATFRGTYNVVTDLELAYDATHEQIATKLGQVIATADNNDYAFVQVPVSATSTDIRRTERYKFNGTVWGYEYDLNTSGFTAVQWEAINSGITALLVSKLTNLPTAEVLATMFAAKQNVLTFDAAPTALSTNPVYSGGVYAAIKAITDLIPAEATNLNQLADKAYVLASILAATPAFKGQFTSLVDLQAVSSPKAGDLGIVRTKDNDGKDVFTFYQYLNNQWNVYFSLSYHPQTKPATTGTTGDYPYNGMGRVELPMNMVGGVNTLTQSMMPTATGGNTIYVIKYDFTLGEDITVPSNCVLEFDGGSISVGGENANTITGQDTRIDASLVQIFDVDIKLHGTWVLESYYAIWQGLVPNDNTIDFGSVITKILENIVMMFPRRIWSSGKSRSGINIVLVAGQYYAATSVNLNTLTADNPDPNNPLISYSLDNVGIIGASKNSVQISSTNNETFFVLDKTTSVPYGIQRIKNIIFREYHGGIRMHGATDLIIEDCSFFGKAKGIVLDLACNVTVRNCIFQCTNGIEFTSTYAGSTTTTYIEHCWFQHCSGVAITANSHAWDANTVYGYNVTVKDSIIEYCTKGIYLYDSVIGTDQGNHNIFTFDNCHIEVNGGSEITGGFTKFVNCTFDKTTVDGVTDNIIIYKDNNTRFIWEGKDSPNFYSQDKRQISILTDTYILDYYHKYIKLHKSLLLTYDDVMWKKLLLRYTDKSGNYYIGILEATGTPREYAETEKIAGNVTLGFAYNYIQIAGGDPVEPKAEIFGFGETWDYES